MPAGKNYGPLGTMDQLKRLLYSSGVGGQIGSIAGKLRLDRFAVKFARRLLRVLSNVHEHWTRSSGIAT